MRLPFSHDQFLDLFRAEGGNPRARIWGSDDRVSLQQAALANGYLGHLEDYDDTHFPTVLHPSSPTVPAAYAVAEDMHLGGRELLNRPLHGLNDALGKPVDIDAFGDVECALEARGELLLGLGPLLGGAGEVQLLRRRVEEAVESREKGIASVHAARSLITPHLPVIHPDLTATNRTPSVRPCASS